MVGESFLPTVRTLMNAPATSPLAEVDPSNVVELLVELTRPGTLIKPSANHEVGLAEPRPRPSYLVTSGRPNGVSIREYSQRPDLPRALTPVLVWAD